MSYALPSVKVGPPDFQTVEEAQAWCAALYDTLLSLGFFVRKEAQEQRDRQRKINVLTAETSIASGDLVPIYDVSAAAHRKITQRNLLGGQAYTPSNDTTSRTFDADAVTTAELADVVATMLRDMKLA